VSKKSAKIAELLRGFEPSDVDPHYAGYFACFNREQFYEAHDVLEELWLKQRGQANDLFFKGLIQLAGAFVHLQKERLKPAAALFRLAQTNLKKYPPEHERLGVDSVLAVIHHWLRELEMGNFETNPLHHQPPPKLQLKV